MSRLSLGEVERIAGLARIALAPDEAGRLLGELEQILAHVDSLARLDTQGVEAMAHAMTLATPLRDDRAEAPLDPDWIRACAPECEGTAFVVPRVIEGEAGG